MPSSRLTVGEIARRIDRNDGLSRWWRRSGQAKQAFIRDHRAELEAALGRRRFADAAPVSPDASTPSNPGYVYHATNDERVHDIAREGLKPHRPWEFTEQDAWPDGGTEPRVYFTPRAGSAWQFAPEEGRSVLLRVPAMVAQRGDGTGDRFARKKVPASNIEILTTDGWVPLASWE